jgi:hypothetical protein
MASGGGVKRWPALEMAALSCVAERTRRVQAWQVVRCCSIPCCSVGGELSFDEGVELVRIEMFWTKTFGGLD